MAIGKAILLMAKERNITKYRISKRSGVTQTTLGEITNGKNTNPTVETTRKDCYWNRYTIIGVIKKSRGA